MMLGATGLLIGAFFLNSLYLQHVLGASALETGLAFLPLAIVIGLSAHVSSHALQRAGARAVVIAGVALVAGGALLLAIAPDRADYLSDLLPGFLALGAGVGLVFPAVSITAMADVAHEDSGMASGLMQTSHEIGAALGVAVMSAVAAAVGSQATAAAGYESGFIAAAVIAGILGVLALATVPTTRPAATGRAFAH